MLSIALPIAIAFLNRTALIIGAVIMGLMSLFLVTLFIVKLLYYSYKIRKKLEITHRLSRSTILYAYV